MRRIHMSIIFKSMKEIEYNPHMQKASTEGFNPLQSRLFCEVILNSEGNRYYLGPVFNFWKFG
jgi:hypothetical protein